MSRLLQALAWIAPGAALSRVQALSTIERVRAYDGAKTGRRAGSFSAGPTSANTEIGPALTRLRSRSRELARNTWAGARILDVHVAHSVGTGITAVPATGSDRTDRLLGEAWAEWCERSDVEGVLNFGGQQALSVRTMLEGGEGLIRRIPLAADELDGRRVPLALQLMEGDFIDASRDGGIFDGHYSRLGVGLGQWRRRTGFWLHESHPGEFGSLEGSYRSNFIEASDLIHLHRPLRPGQVRGVPIFAPILLTARDFADLVDAVVIKTRTEACFTGFVKAPPGSVKSLGGQVKENGKQQRVIEKLAPGMINYLEPGEEITFAEPTGSGQYDQVWLSTLLGMAAGAGLTYDQVTGDLRQANYSSLRAGKIEQRRLTEQTQELILVPQLMRRVTGWFVEAAIFGGVLKPRKGGWPFTFVMPAVEPIDPRKDLEADILAVRSGRMTPQAFIASWGEDWRKVVEDTRAFFAMADEMGLVLDIDPRRTSQTGVAQLPAGETNPTDPPKATAA